MFYTLGTLPDEIVPAWYIKDYVEWYHVDITFEFVMDSIIISADIKVAPTLLHLLHLNVPVFCLQTLRLLLRPGYHKNIWS